MIWGMTYAAREDRMKTTRVWFAWHPVALDDGRMAWLCSVVRYWYEDQGANWAGDSSRWRYQEFKP